MTWNGAAGKLHISIPSGAIKSQMFMTLNRRYEYEFQFLLVRLRVKQITYNAEKAYKFQFLLVRLRE